MKLLLILSVMLSTQFAFADSFFCELRIGDSAPITEISEYRGRSVEVKTDVYSCSATIDSETIVTSTILSTSTGREHIEVASSRGSSAIEMSTRNEDNSEEVVLKCSCGLM